MNSILQILKTETTTRRKKIDDAHGTTAASSIEG